LVTKRAYDLIKRRTEDLEAVVTSASSDEQRAELQRDLRYWRARLATAQMAPVAMGDAVAFGTRVGIEQDGNVRTLTIVGHDEADPAAGLLAFASPLAQALMGAEPGEDINQPGSERVVRVISVESA
jgi:transcription elongation GreA/GreB family factor